MEQEEKIMIELTPEQINVLGAEGEPRLVDPRTNTVHVLVRADVHARATTLLGDDFHPSEAYATLDGAFSDGWDDPKMDDYDRYEELKRGILILGMLNPRKIMALRINLPADTENLLKEKAARAGQTLEAYLQGLIEREATMACGTGPSAPTLSAQQWSAQWRAWANQDRRLPAGIVVDDSRESIYGEHSE